MSKIKIFERIYSILFLLISILIIYCLYEYHALSGVLLSNGFVISSAVVVVLLFTTLLSSFLRLNISESKLNFITILCIILMCISAWPFRL